MDGGAKHQREFTRVRVQVDAQVSAQGRTIRSSEAQDLSMKGLLVRTPERLPEGTACEVRLVLAAGGPEVRAEGTVVRVYAYGFAVQFTRLLGMESYEHLRNLVLYNAGDEERLEHIEEEFHSHLGIRRKD